MTPFNPACTCGHPLRAHSAFRSLSPFTRRPCTVEACECADFAAGDNDYEEGRATAAESDTKSLLEAMLAVQAEAPTLDKDRTVTVKTKTGGEYTYSYTPLDSIVEKVGPLLHKHGLVWMTRPSWSENIGPTLKYKIAHAPSKEFEEGEMPLMLGEDPDAQAMGSAITYMRRYALCAVLNLVADMDDDGAGAGRGGGRSSGGGGRRASEKQIEYLKSLLKKQKATVKDIRAVLAGNGVTVAPDADPAPLIDALSSQQASSIIEFLKEGKPVPDAERPGDLPPAGADEFKHAPAEDEAIERPAPEVPS